MLQTIAIIGAGSVGRALGDAWRAGGHAILYGVRDPAKAQLDGAKTPQEAAAAADVIVLATPWAAAVDVARSLKGVAGKTLIDCTNPVTVDANGVAMIDLGGRAAAELIAEATEAAVVKTLNQVGANIMTAARAYPHPPLMFVAGDDDRAKAEATALVRAAGFDPRDAGPLRHALALEHLAMLWIDQAFRGAHGRDFALSLHTPRASAENA